MPTRPETVDEESKSGPVSSGFITRNDANVAHLRWSLLDKHSHALYGFVRRMVGNRDDADELYQELALAILQHPKGPEDVEQFAAWCRGLARHLLSHFYRTQRRRADLLTQVRWDNGRKFNVWAHDPEHLTATYEILNRALGRIDDRSIQLMVSRHLYGESAAEIAERTAQSPAAVRMKLMRLRCAAKRSA